MVGDGEILQAGLARLKRHLLDRGASVGIGRMAVQIAAQVAALKQARADDACGRRLDLAAVLAQFGRDQGQAQRAVNFFLAGARHALVAAEQSVLVEQHPGALRHAPQMDAMGLGAGEVHQRGAVAFARHHAQVNLQPAAQHDAGFGLALAQHLLDSG